MCVLERERERERGKGEGEKRWRYRKNERRYTQENGDRAKREL